MSDMMDVDIVCVGFGPAMGGFLTTLCRVLPEFPIPPHVICYERADGINFGVSGVVTRARGIRHSFPDLDASQIPMATRVASEKVIYLLDPIGASRRSFPVRTIDRAARGLARPQLDAIELPWTPEFLHKSGGLVMSIGQFNQWAGEQVMMSGMAQIWPGMPVSEPLIENNSVVGVKLAQGDMEVRARLTVVGDGPVGSVSRRLDDVFGTPPNFERNEWAVGAKMVVDLPVGVDLEPGTVFHTIGYPEPEIFGFFYVHPDRIASVGIFVPSWFDNPTRTSYRYLQHFVQHPYLSQFLQGGRMRSWGAKSLMESGRRAEPFLVGHGYARIGETTGSTNVLTGSGVDEAWTTGVQLGEGVIELLREKAPYTRENLERAYVARRRNSWVEREGRIAENARNGFQKGFVSGMLGMGLAGLTNGQMVIHEPAARKLKSIEDYYSDRIPRAEIAAIQSSGGSLHDEFMNRSGWPAIEYDGQLLVSHQDALLLGGKVQGAAGFEDHVQFVNRELCGNCRARVCVEMCSGEAITSAAGEVAFDREKCVHCGACLWNCPSANIEFRAGGGGLHSAEN